MARYSDTKVLYSADTAWPNDASCSPCMRHESVKTLTTNDGQWFACERCSEAWFKTYVEIKLDALNVSEVKP